MTPNALRMDQALGMSAPLAQLQRRLLESQARLDVVRTVLPTALAAHLKAGPVDEDGWSVLAANAAVAAKLRQLQPRMESALRARGWQVTAIRIKLQSS